MSADVQPPDEDPAAPQGAVNPAAPQATPEPGDALEGASPAAPGPDDTARYPRVPVDPPPTEPPSPPTAFPLTGDWPSPPAPPTRPETGSRRRLVAGLAVLAVAASLAGVGIGYGVWGSGSSPASSTSGTQSPTTAPGSGSSLNATAVAAKVNPGLVDVNVTLGYQGGEAAGTGMVLTSSGTVLTNNHVIDGATSIRATDIGNGKTYTATVVGYDMTGDIAVLQLQGASNLATVSIGDSSAVKVGDPVVAIGNAGGAGGTPSAVTGTVTALNQSITASSEATGAAEQLSGLIATNAPIEAGDSGGPLVTANGKVVGMVTAATSRFFFGQQGGQGGGQGYAIPSNTARTVAAQITGGQASDQVHIGTTAFLGVRVASAGAGAGFRFGEGFPRGFGPPSGSSPTTPTTPTTGAVVVGVEPGTPAAAAGLVAGDVIVSVNGQDVVTPTTLTTLLQAHHPGDAVQLGWQDASGQPHTATVTLTTGPAG